MPQTKLTPAQQINTPQALDDLIQHLKTQSLVAFDTESNSMYAYQERVCLVQVSTRQADYIIDPLAVDITPLGAIMADPQIEKLFHGAEYDITCLKRDYGFAFCNLFDTMVAARVCGFDAFGLSELIKRYIGIRLNKRHQRDNWGKRPLSEASLRYAQMDTHYLPTLRDALRLVLEEKGRIAEAREAFAEVCQTPAATPRQPDPHAFWNIGVPRMLKDRELMILRELIDAREHLAQKYDKPPHRILHNKLLVNLARRPPTERKGLKQNLSCRQFQWFSKALMSAIRRGQQANRLPPRPRRHSAPDPITADRYACLQAWRKERASKRGVESDVIMPKRALWEIAERAPHTLDDLRQIDSIGPWKFNAYGHEILSVLAAYEGDDGHNANQTRG